MKNLLVDTIQFQLRHPVDNPGPHWTLYTDFRNYSHWHKHIPVNQLPTAEHGSTCMAVLVYTWWLTRQLHLQPRLNYTKPTTKWNTTSCRDEKTMWLSCHLSVSLLVIKGFVCLHQCHCVLLTAVMWLLYVTTIVLMTESNFWQR